ncbi:hypothetical protein [Methanobrevibacter sp.]|uniref:hypothetical protein n=1 Tax=Methanobrevibacter sp. TaxID=66852 RepID=UPI00388FD3CF
MNIKRILVIAIIVLAVFSCLSIASAGLFDFLSGEQYLQDDNSQVTIPSNYTVDDKKIVASCKGINISLVAQKSVDDKFETEFFNAVNEGGKEAGYENVSNKTINGYTVHEFAASPSKLKNLTGTSSREDVAWIEYPPQIAAPFDNPVDHFRSVTFIKDGKEHRLLISTNNTADNLYTPEIEGIINSIGPLKK